MKQARTVTMVIVAIAVHECLVRKRWDGRENNND